MFQKTAREPLTVNYQVAGSCHPWSQLLGLVNVPVLLIEQGRCAQMGHLYAVSRCPVQRGNVSTQEPIIEGQPRRG